MENERSLRMLRNSTTWFIAQDPTSITLVRRVAQKTNTGAFTPGTATPQAAQVVKLIGNSEDGVKSSEGSQDRSFEYTVLLRHDGNIQIGDYWKAGDAFWQVYALEPTNGYEIKARARQFSKAPSDG